MRTWLVQAIWKRVGVVALVGATTLGWGVPGALAGAPPAASGTVAPAEPSKLIQPESQERLLDAHFPVRSKHMSQTPAIAPVGHVFGAAAGGVGGPPGPVDRSGNTIYSVSHLLGYTVGNMTFPVYIYGTGGGPDDIVIFDGVEEQIRRDITGTIPLVTESRLDRNPWLTSLKITTRANDGTDLFPGGYTVQGNPLTDAAFFIGLQQPLLWPTATRVRACTIQFFRDGLEFSPLIPLDPAVFFEPAPWDGTTGIVFRNLAGQGVDKVELSITLDVIAPGDFNSDIDVDVADRDTFFQNMVRPTRMIDGDFDNNGEVTMRDFQTMQNICTSGNCSDIYLDEDDSPIIPWMNANGSYITASNQLIDLLTDQIIRILNETGQVARIEIIQQRIQQISVQVMYFKRIERSVAVIDFLDGGPSMKILYEQTEEFIEVWYQRYDQRITLIRQAGTVEAASLAQFRTFCKALGFLGKGIGIGSALLTASQPCLLEGALRDFGEMFDDQPSGLCIPPCLSFFNYLGQLFGFCFGRLEAPLQVGAYYGCIIICDELQYIYTPSQMAQIRGAFFNVAQQIRIRFGC